VLARHLAFTLGTILAMHSAAVAQTSAGAILGTVTDATGARIPGVQITATNEGTNQSREVATTETGDYRIDPVQVGTYSVSAELPGFQKVVQRGLKVDVDARLRIDFTLQVGAVSDVVEVTGTAPVVQTDNSQVGQVVDDRKIVELPLNGRQFSSLAYITPGTFAPRPGSHLSERGGFVAAGMEEQANGFILDGVNGNAAATMEPVIRVNLDAVAEFKIQTQNFSAQYGRFAGAQVDAITKSGTNQFKGDLFAFGRTSKLDTRNFFDVKKPTFRRYQYGGVLGGPIVKDKAFFFVGFQGQRQVNQYSINETVPLPEFWTGNLSRLNKTIRDPLTGQAFQNSQIPPNRISSIALNFKPLWERAVLVNPNATVSNALSYFSQPANYWLPNTKINYTLSPNQQLIFSYGVYKEDFLEYLFNRPDIPGFQTCCNLKNQIISLQHVWTISSTMINEARAGISRSNRTRHPEHMEQNYAKALGINGTASDADPRLYATPEIQIAGYAKLGDSTNQDRVDGNWTGADVFSLQKGNHAMKFGVDYMRQYIDSTPFFFDMGGLFSFNGFATGDPFADFLLGYIGSDKRGPPVPGVNDLTSYLFRKDYGWFAQDDWKFSPNLTLNIGLRWDLFGPLDEKYGKVSTFDPSMDGGRGGIRILTKGLRRLQPAIDFYKSLYPTLAIGTSDTYTKWEKRNPGPRFGFAWTPFGKTNTVVRGGYGLFYQVEDLCFCSQPQQTPFTFTQTFNQNDHPMLNNPWPGLGGGTITIDSLKYDLEATRYEHWNLGVQRELPGSVVLDVSYVAKRGTRVNRYRDINQKINGVKPYPLFAPIPYDENGARLMYQGMQLRVERRVANGFTILNSYAWAHEVDTGQPRKNGSQSSYRDSYNLNLEKGNGIEDARHRLSTTFVWDFPKAEWLPGIANQLFNGWQISGIVRANSGNWLTPTISTDNSGDARFADRPDLIGDPTHQGKVDPRTSFWNKAALRMPAPGTHGTAGRGTLLAPGYFGTDMAFEKRMSVTESNQVQFRWELFNIFNRANFFNPVTNFSGANFGTISQAYPGRQMQLGLKWLF